MHLIFHVEVTFSVASEHHLQKKEETKSSIFTNHGAPGHNYLFQKAFSIKAKINFHVLKQLQLNATVKQHPSAAFSEQFHKRSGSIAANAHLCSTHPCTSTSSSAILCSASHGRSGGSQSPQEILLPHFIIPGVHAEPSSEK